MRHSCSRYYWFCRLTPQAQCDKRKSLHLSQYCFPIESVDAADNTYFCDEVCIECLTSGAERKYSATDESPNTLPELHDYIARHARIEGMDVDGDSSAQPSPTTSKSPSVPEPVAHEASDRSSPPVNHDPDIIYISSDDDDTTQAHAVQS